MVAQLQKPLESIKIYTHNVDRVLKPSQDGELAHAIHETLHYALDGDERDYLISRSALPMFVCEPETSSSVKENGNSTADEEIVHPGFVATNDPNRPYASYLWNEKTSNLTLPNPSTVLKPLLSDTCTVSENEQDLREAFDVTTKFFYLNDAQKFGESLDSPSYPAHWIHDALNCLSTATGLTTVDTLILAFSKLKIDCPKANDEQISQKSKKVAEIWKEISTDQRVLSLGLSDVSQRSLRAFISHLDLPECDDLQGKREAAQDEAKKLMENAIVQKGSEKIKSSVNGDKDEKNEQPIQIPSSPSKVSLGPERLDERTELIKVYGPSPCRRPRLCTINLREQNCDQNSLGGQSVSNTNLNGTSCWDRGLADYCKEENILLVAHSDQKDILPDRSIPTLLGEFEGRIPHAMASNKRLEPVWCLKYTVLIRDRGVLADKGFVLFCKAVEA